MITKDDLHRLIDQLPEAAVPTVAQYLTTIKDDPLLQALASAPLEDEELSAEEAAALARAWQRFQDGDGSYVTDEQLARELGG